jgi:hypothetical protein
MFNVGASRSVGVGGRENNDVEVPGLYTQSPHLILHWLRIVNLVRGDSESDAELSIRVCVIK